MVVKMSNDKYWNKLNAMLIEAARESIKRIGEKQQGKCFFSLSKIEDINMLIDENPLVNIDIVNSMLHRDEIVYTCKATYMGNK